MSNSTWNCEDDEIIVVDEEEPIIIAEDDFITLESGVTGAIEKRLNSAQMKEQQQKFAMLHFLYGGLNDFLGIKPNEEV